MNKYKIVFADRIGMATKPDITIQARSVELENGFFTFLGEIKGQDEIVFSLESSQVKEVRLIEDPA